MITREDLKNKNENLYNEAINNVKGDNVLKFFECIKKVEKKIKHAKKIANKTKKLNELNKLRKKNFLSSFEVVESNMGNIDNTNLSNTEKSNQHSI